MVERRLKKSVDLIEREYNSRTSNLTLEMSRQRLRESAVKWKIELIDLVICTKNT